MFFKQIRLYQLSEAAQFSPASLIEKLEPLSFRGCLPSMPQSAGWVSPIEEDEAPLVQPINGYMMLCLQVEEKILPAIVIRQELVKKIKHIEKLENRKVYQTEKNRLKDEIVITLLPRAFSKLTRVYGYLDTNKRLLVLGTANEKKAEQFIMALRKAINSDVSPFEVKNLSYTMTQWLQHQSYSSSFAIEKSCVLQDANQEKRVIRCQQQDLFAQNVQAFIKDGCHVKQLALEWQDRIGFVLMDDFSLQSIRYQDDIVAAAKDMEAETALQRFSANFYIMTQCLTELIRELLDELKINSMPKENIAA